MDRVLTAFNNIYPLLGFELGEIIRILRETFKIHKQSIADWHKISLKQQTCNHKRVEKEVEIGINKYTKYCIKCSKKQKVKRMILDLKKEIVHSLL